MERYSLIVVTDETAPIRRYDVQKRVVKRLLALAGFVALILLGGLVDYVRVRVEHTELEPLRGENALQRARIAEFEETLASLDTKLAQLREFERKVRIIANLPGAAGSGGGEVPAAAPAAEGTGAGGEDESDAGPGGRGGGSGTEIGSPWASAESAELSPADRVVLMRRDAERLDELALARSESLGGLVDKLEDKRHKLESTPSIWPTKGWLTSRFGHRISPFTGKRQFHAGIDIAGAKGTDIVAPARGKVAFTGKRGPLGKSLILDHGFGIRTHYGHLDEIHVKRGADIARGQRIAALGNTGRSTGPHLHYSVEINGKSVNPLDYIFD